MKITYILKKEVKKMDKKIYGTILIGLLILMQGVYAATTASRTLSKSSVSPGGTVTVTIAVDMGSGVKGCGLVEVFPDGWSVSDYGAGVIKTNPTRLEWLFFTGSDLTDQTVTYKLTAPSTASAGTYQFKGNVTATPPGETTDTAGTSTISVVTTTTSTTTTTTPPVYTERSMASTVKVGGSVLVSIDLEIDESKTITSVGVRESIPSGWTVSGISDGGVFQTSTNRVEWIFGNYSPDQSIRDRTLTYTLTPPTGVSAGTVVTLSGQVIYYVGGSEETGTTGGNSQITVVKKTSSTEKFKVVMPTTITTGSEIKVQVLNSDSNKPVDKVAVRVYQGKDESGKKVFNGLTDKNGTIVFTLQEAGDYALTLDKDRYKDLLQVFTVAAGEATTTTTTSTTTTTMPPVTTTREITTTTRPLPTTTRPLPTTTRPLPTTTTTMPPVTTTMPVVTTTAPTQPPADNTMMLVLIVIVVLIIAAVAYYMSKKGKAKPSGNGNNKAAAEKGKTEKGKGE